MLKNIIISAPPLSLHRSLTLLFPHISRFHPFPQTKCLFLPIPSTSKVLLLLLLLLPIIPNITILSSQNVIYIPKPLSLVVPISAENSETDDSDVEFDNGGQDAYYRPISAHEDLDSDDAIEFGDDSPVLSNGGDQNDLRHPNPNAFHLHPENGISSLDLNGDGRAGEMEGEEAEEADREREASISRAFWEDESRRTAPLTPENAARIVDAMRSVSFPGYAPDWADKVPEDRWMDQLRRPGV